MTRNSRRVLVLIPTYNEVENIANTIDLVARHLPEADILVLDDASPDGTGALVDDISSSHPRVSVRHGARKSGLGAAYLAGFEAGLSKNYDVLVEFDADGSHPADRLPAVIEELSDNRVGLVIGSRWVAGGRVEEWSAGRIILSRAGNAYARIVLGLPVRDSTAGFRAYSSDCLRSLDLVGVKTKGYGFQVDMTRRTIEAGFLVREIPITFRERQHGVSKMSGGIVLEAIVMVTLWGLMRPVRYVQRALSRR